MSRKHFSLLLIVTLAVAVVVLLLPGRTGHESGMARATFMPDLQAEVNALDWLRIRGPGDRVVATLQRSGDHWQVEEANGYRADWERLRGLLADLAQAEIVEPKTDNPAYYSRLGVEDVDAPDASGLEIEFAESTGLPAVIVGKRAEGREGCYVRRADSAASALIDRNLELPATTADWLETDIVDIPDSEVVEVDIQHPDGERVVARKVSADDEHFQLEDMPEGREIRSAWTVDSLANALSSLTLEAVRPQAELNWDGALQFAVVTADGLRVDASLIDVGNEAAADADGSDADAAAPGEYWIRLQAGLYQTALDRAVQESVAGEPGDDMAAESGETVDPAERARTINARVEGWAYRIPKYKFDAMNKNMADLLKALPEAET